MTYSNLLFDCRDGIARITLNRPDRLNSFNDAMHAELRDALPRIASDVDVRVLLLTGAGRGFCAGQDLADRAVAPGGEAVDLGASIERNYMPLVLGLRALPVPVVCAVNGVAAGAGATSSSRRRAPRSSRPSARSASCRTRAGRTSCRA
jgi:2-(1,2-epoxy-1,2-dihydrophenyl)acetyl-CoA isomerase